MTAGMLVRFNPEISEIMSTNPDEQNASDDVVEQKQSSPAATESATEQPAVETASGDASSGEEASPAPSEQPVRKILIGSQRDEADPEMGTRKTIRHVSISPGQVGAAIQGAAATAATVEETTEAKPSEEKPAEAKPAEAKPAEPEPTTTQPVVGKATPGAGDVDAELEAALGDLQMESLLGANQPAGELEIESRIKALVTRIHNDNVFFSLKGRYEGIASGRQFKTPPEEGAMLDVVVTGFKEDEGLYEVSIPGASVAVADWSDLVEGAVIEARVTGSNTGGLEVNVNNIRGFIPASQIDVVRVENFGDYVNQKLQCVVTEVNPRRKKLVLSRRAILEREQNEKKKELMATLTAGQTLDGVVTKLMDFGAFVDIGGVEGLVHVSKMSWERVNHPSEVLQPGQKIPVKIEKINAETGKISLSYRDTMENPWTRIDQKYPEGSVVGGTVSRLAQFGAFVKLEPGVEGLVHISELAHHRVIAVKNVVKQGDTVQVKVLSVDPQAQKIGLSLKATQARPEKPDARQEEKDEPIREAAVKKRSEPLKGGRDRGSGGEQFGLNW